MSFQHTYSADPNAEQIIRNALDGIRSDIKKLPQAGQLTAVVLGGGYGRGEGGVTDAGTLYNDIDFFLLSPHVDDLPGLMRSLSEISLKWSRELKIDVDFAPPRPIENFIRNAHTQMVQELLAGHLVILGDRDALSQVPRIPWSELPFSEGARLLLNRGTGLLLAENKLAKNDTSPEAYDFIRRNIHKAALGCGDAMLIANHAYQRTGVERRDMLDRIDLPESLRSLYAEALEYKYHPAISLVTDCQERYRIMLDVWFKTLAEFASSTTGRSATTPLEGAVDLAVTRFSDSRDSVWKSILLNLRYAGTLPFFRYLLVHPRQKLLFTLVESLRDPRAEHLRNLHLSFWKRFN